MITSKKKKLKQEQKVTQKVEQKINIRIGDLGDAERRPSDSSKKKKSRKQRLTSSRKVKRMEKPLSRSEIFTPPQTLYPYRPTTTYIQQPAQSQRDLNSIQDRLKDIEKSISERPYNILRREELKPVHPIQNYLQPNIGGYTPSDFSYNIPSPPDNPSYFDIPQAFHRPVTTRSVPLNLPPSNITSQDDISEVGWGAAYFGTEPSSPVPIEQQEREEQRDEQAYFQLSSIVERERQRPSEGFLAHQPQIQRTPQYVQQFDYPNEEYDEEEVEINIEKEKGGGRDSFEEWLRNSSNISEQVNNRPKIGYTDSLDSRSNANSIVSTERGEYREMPSLIDELNLQQGVLPQDKLVYTVNEVVRNALQKEKEERTKKLFEETPEEIEEERKREIEIEKRKIESETKEKGREELISEARLLGINVGNSSVSTIRRKIDEKKSSKT